MTEKGARKAERSKGPRIGEKERKNGEGVRTMGWWAIGNTEK